MDRENPVYVRSFEDPDEVLELEGILSQLLSLGGLAVARTVHRPGWRWSTHLQPVMKTEWCETHHVGVCLSGTLEMRLDSGLEFEIAAGDVFAVPAGHDAWVAGEEAWVSVEWSGVLSWLPFEDTLAERVLATVVFTDIVGSTEMAERLGPVGWSDLLATHEAQARDLLARFRGRKVKSTGDGLLALFESPARAVRFTLALQAAAGSIGLQLRMGVHAGEVEIAGADLRGVAVHEASRIVSLARPSEVLVSEITKGLLGDRQFAFEDRGEHVLRGLSARRRLFAVRPR